MASDSHAGRLVVATPDLADPNFSHTVVLVLEHDDDGALGIVLNRPSEVPVADALPGWSRLASHPEVVFVGGPVETDAIIALGLARGAGQGEEWRPIVGRLRAVDLTRDPDAVDDLEQIRVFAGYAGWTGGQLDHEVEEGGWFVVDALDDDAITRDPSQLWRRVLTRQGGIFRTVADDPSLN